MEIPATGLPLAVETLLESLANSMLLTSWNVSGGKTVSVTLRFANQDGSQSICTPGSYRRKPPSSLRRDRERKQRWVERNNDNQNSDTYEESNRISNAVGLGFSKNINNIDNDNEHEYSSGAQNAACQTTTCATKCYDSGINCSVESDLQTQYPEPKCVDSKSETLTSNALAESSTEHLSENLIKVKCDDTILGPSLNQNIDFDSNLSLCSSEKETKDFSSDFDQVQFTKSMLKKYIYKSCGVCDKMLDSHGDLIAIHVCTHCNDFYLCFDCFESENYKIAHDHKFEFKPVYWDST